MSDSESGVPLIEPLSPSPSLPNKRKRGDESGAKKANKRKRTKKPKDIYDGDLDEVAGINRAIAHMEPRMLADHVAQRTRRFETELSVVELEDRYLPEPAIHNTTGWTQQRNLENLPGFVGEFARVSKKGVAKENGRPHTLVVAGAGLRAADLARALRKLQTPTSAVAKLFAKHIKLAEAITTCQKTRMGIGVGTPQRISDLLENGALSAAKLKWIIVDASHIDVKKRGILDMKEVQVPLINLLMRNELKERYGLSSGSIEILFY